MAIAKGHRLALTSRLVILDEALCDFERWAQGHAVRSALYVQENDLTASQREKIGQEVQEARRALAQMRERLGLEQQTQPARRSIAGRCAILWEILTELEPKYLARYGAVDEELAACASEGVTELRRRVTAIGRAVAKRR